MKTAVYVGYSRKPLEVAILRSTATRHRVVSLRMLRNSEERFEDSKNRTREQVNPDNSFASQWAAKHLSYLEKFKSGDEWVDKIYGKWVTFPRVFNITESSR